MRNNLGVALLCIQSPDVRQLLRREKLDIGLGDMPLDRASCKRKERTFETTLKSGCPVAVRCEHVSSCISREDRQGAPRHSARVSRGMTRPRCAPTSSGKSVLEARSCQSGN